MAGCSESLTASVPVLLTFPAERDAAHAGSPADVTHAPASVPVLVAFPAERDAALARVIAAVTRSEPASIPSGAANDDLLDRFAERLAVSADELGIALGA